MRGKAFDFEVYPGELHFFRRKHILRDAWSAPSSSSMRI